MSDTEGFCPACCKPCPRTGCSSCGYRRADGAPMLSLDEILTAPSEGPAWDGVDLPAFARSLVAHVAVTKNRRCQECGRVLTTPHRPILNAYGAVIGCEWRAEVDPKSLQR